jgi:PAS domain S-box/diguanylate cyclase (GGDEF) domain
MAGAWGLASLWLLTGGGSDTERRWVTDLLPIVLDLGAAACILVAALRAPTRRAALTWLLLGIATLVFAMADGLFAWYQIVLQVEPFPTPADVAYVAYYPLMVVALLSFPAVATDRTERIRFGIDSLIVLVGGGMVVWHTVMQSTLESLDGSLSATLLAVGYPVGDLILLFGVAGISLRRLVDVDPRALVALVVGLLLVLIADIGFALLTLESTVVWPDVLYMASPVVIAAAAYFQIRGTSRPIRPEARASAGISRPLLYLPYVAMAGGYTTLILAAVAGDPHVVQLSVGAILVTVLVLARQELVLGENSRLLASQARLDSEARFKRMAGNASDAITLVDGMGNVCDATDSSFQVLGLEPHKLIGRSIVRLAHVDDAAGLARLIEDAVARRPGSGRLEWRLWDGDGVWRQVETVAANLLDDPTIGKIVLTTRDVRERKVFEQRLRQITEHDVLTGLPNRSTFLGCIDEALRTSGQAHATTVLVTNIDGFKRVNNSFGHPAGDRVLQDVARQLAGTLRSGDTCARIGGDEFGILLGGRAGLDDARAAAGRIVAALGEELAVGTSTTHISVRIGIAMGIAGGSGASALVRNAELASSYARHGGLDGIAVFELTMRAEVEDKVDLESELRLAVKRDELVLRYQPIVDLVTGDVMAAEALVRWNHPVRGLLAPNVFVQIAEESGLIDAIGNWVLTTACLEVSRWARIAHARVPRIAVNLSPHQIADPNLPWTIQEALARAGAATDWLSLEVTEGLLMEDTEAVLERLHAIRSLGISIAIDDFGTGFSSLAYLQRFPVSYIKIDRSFVTPLADPTADSGLVRAVIEIGRSLSMATVAEGIETQVQLDRLRALGCGLGQGFLLGRPMDSAAFRALIANPIKALPPVAAPRRRGRGHSTGGMRPPEPSALAR